MAYAHIATATVSAGDLIKAGTGTTPAGGTINNLIYNLYFEQQRRSKTVTTSSPAVVSSGSAIKASTFTELKAAILALKTISGMYDVSSGTTIKAVHYNAFKVAIDNLYATCVCNCNYCTCNCQYTCTCNCNYSCTCQCNYSCTCQCNYSSCPSNTYCNHTARTDCPSQTLSCHSHVSRNGKNWLGYNYTVSSGNYPSCTLNVHSSGSTESPTTGGDSQK